MMSNLYFISVVAMLAIVSPVFINAWPENMGCFTDEEESRLMRGSWIDMDDLTVEKCTKRCQDLDYKYAGVQNGKGCHCANEVRANLANEKAADAKCDKACAGDESEKCGGHLAIQIYKLKGYMGCYLDDWDRMLDKIYIKSVDVDIAECRKACGMKKYAYAGLENGNECFCDNKIDTTKHTPKPESDCNMPCAADGGQICGGPLRLSVYYLGHGNPFIGCYKHETGEEGEGMMKADHEEFEKNSQTMCLTHCKGKGFTYAGIKNGKDCYCDSSPSIFGGDYHLHKDAECDIPCPGNPDQMCGGESSWTVLKTK